MSFTYMLNIYLGLGFGGVGGDNFNAKLTRPKSEYLIFKM